LLAAVVLFVSAQAGNEIERSANEQLASTNRALSANVSVWLQLNIEALHQLVSLPDMKTMELERQKPILEAMAEAHPHMYLVSTTDMKGFNVARSDDAEPKDYHDRLWHIGARNGAAITYQTLVGRTSGEPALVVSMPIRRELGTIVGVGMFASDLDAISQEVRASAVGETGFAYVVDNLNQVVAHPVAEYAAELRDLDYYPPVFALRGGLRGSYAFTDEEGIAWQAYVSELENGWGVVVQQQESELFGTLWALQRVSWFGVGVGALILAGLMVLAIRQVVQPIVGLTDTATAIAAGELERTAPVESQDEIGTLARSFNSMTGQLRELIGSLEQQVEERTAELVRRSGYLQATADVGRAAASILEPESLTRQVVELIRERFTLYYVGLFLVDERGEWAVLQAGTGEAGRTMLARNHRIRLGEGMIGWCVAAGQPRVAEEAGEDAVRLATEELPETRSEAALPLVSRGQVYGALTVQHTEPGAFGPDVLAVLQTMADQVAVALDNARLFAASQEALQAERRAYGELSREAWRLLLRGQAGRGYRYTPQEVVTVEGDPSPEMIEVERRGQIVQDNGGSDATLLLPIKVRDQVLGVLRLRKEAASSGGAQWLADEIDLLEELATQLGVALEGARLYQDTQRRAAQERLTGEATARMRQTLDVDTVLQTAVREMRQALGLVRAEVWLGEDAGTGGNGGDGGHAPE
jgi:GAF domain-containing protein/HAMP domain-containing protein